MVESALTIVGAWSVEKRLFYFVQAQGRPLETCPSGAEAERRAQAYAARGVPVVAYMMFGDPEAEVWDEPELLARAG